MQTKLTIDDKEVQEMLNKLESPEIIRGLLKAMGLHLSGSLKEYPVHRPRPVAKYFTDGQRKGFFYKLNKGLIDVPYKRGSSGSSETYNKRWTSKLSGNQMIIGNNASYAKYLAVKKDQSIYHKITGWKTVDDTLDSERTKLEQVLTSTLKSKLDNL